METAEEALRRTVQMFPLGSPVRLTSEGEHALGLSLSGEVIDHKVQTDLAGRPFAFIKIRRMTGRFKREVREWWQANLAQLEDSCTAREDGDR